MAAELRQPVSSEACAGIRIDVLQRLEAWRVRAAKVDMRAAHRKGCRAGRPALVEYEDLGVFIALPLQGEEGEQHRFARAGGPDDQRMADIADMQVEPEGRCAIRLRLDERWCAEVRVLGFARPL